MILNDEFATAVHEAGHAIIGRVMAQKCGDISVVPDHEEMTAGYAITADPMDTVSAWDQAGRWREHRSIVIGRIIALMSGRHAEEELCGACEGGDGGDQNEISAMIDDGAWRVRQDMSESAQALLTRLERFSRVTVHRHRGAISDLAGELIKRKHMTADELADFLQPRLPSWHWPPRARL